MVDNIEPLTALITLTIIVAIWIAIGIRDRRRARQVADAYIATLWERRIINRLCIHVWLGDSGFWVVCSRPHEHTGPHLNHSTGDLDR